MRGRGGNRSNLRRRGGGREGRGDPGRGRGRREPAAEARPGHGALLVAAPVRGREAALAGVRTPGGGFPPFPGL